MNLLNRCSLNALDSFHYADQTQIKLQKFYEFFEKNNINIVMNGFS